MSKLKSTMMLGGAKFLALAINIISVKLYLHWIGDARFGAIIMLQTIGNYCITLGDPGLSSGVQRELVTAINDDDNERISKIVASHHYSMMITGVFAIIVHLMLAAVLRLDGIGMDAERWVFFSLSGLATALFLYSVPLNSLLGAKHRFGPIAAANAIGALFNTSISIALVYTSKHPWGFAAGSFISQTVVILILFSQAKKHFHLGSPFKYWKAEFAESISFAKRNILNNIGSALSTFDKPIVNHALGTGPVGVLGIAQRIPSTINQAMPLMQVFQPEFAQSYLQGENEFRATYVRNSCATLAVAFAFLVVPSALGESVLRLWLGSDFHPQLVWLMIAACLDSAFSLNGYTFSVTAFGAGKPQLAVPFVWFFGIGVLALTLPVSLQWGLLGVSWLRVILQAVQFFALEIVVKKSIIPSINFKQVLLRKFAIVAAGCVWWGIGYALQNSTYVKAHMAMGALAIPFFCLGFLMTCSRLRFYELPQRLTNRLPRILRHLV